MAALSTKLSNKQLEDLKLKFAKVLGRNVLHSKELESFIHRFLSHKKDEERTKSLDAFFAHIRLEDNKQKKEIEAILEEARHSLNASHANHPAPPPVAAPKPSPDTPLAETNKQLYLIQKIMQFTNTVKALSVQFQSVAQTMQALQFPIPSQDIAQPAASTLPTPGQLAVKKFKASMENFIQRNTTQIEEIQEGYLLAKEYASTEPEIQALLNRKQSLEQAEEVFNGMYQFKKLGGELPQNLNQFIDANASRFQQIAQQKEHQHGSALSH